MPSTSITAPSSPLKPRLILNNQSNPFANESAVISSPPSKLRKNAVHLKLSPSVRRIVKNSKTESVPDFVKADLNPDNITVFCREIISNLISSVSDSLIDKPSFKGNRQTVFKEWAKALALNDTQKFFEILKSCQHQGAEDSLDSKLLTSHSNDQRCHGTSDTTGAEGSLVSQLHKDFVPNGAKEKDESLALIEKGDLMKWRDPILRYTPLHWACKHGSKELAKTLIDEESVCVNARTAGKLSFVSFFMYLFCFCFSPEYCFSLLPKGGYTPLHLACMFGHVSVILILLSAGADLNICDNNGETAEDLAKDGCFKIALAKYQRLKKIFGVDVRCDDIEEDASGHCIGDVGGVSEMRSISSSASSWNTLITGKFIW